MIPEVIYLSKPKALGISCSRQFGHWLSQAVKWRCLSVAVYWFEQANVKYVGNCCSRTNASEYKNTNSVW